MAYTITTQFAAIASEIASGKKAIAEAINTKGGEASASDSFTELAEAVEAIPNFNLYNSKWIEGKEPTNVSEVFENMNSYLTELTIYSIGNSGALNLSVLGALRKFSAPNIITFPMFGGSATTLKEVYCPNATTITLNNSLGGYNNVLETVTFGTLTAIGSSAFGSYEYTKLRNITVGAGTNIHLKFALWSATAVIAEGQSGIDELNANIMANLAPNLYQGGGKTLTVRAPLYNVLTQETKDAITARGWNLASS